MENNFAVEKSRMIKEQLRGRGIKDERIIQAFRDTPRHLFVPQGYRNRAYADRPLPIGDGQTISQPYIVAFMTELLELAGDERVLEIGTGSGFQTAILARIVDEVFTVERNGDLQARGESVIKSLGIDNVHYSVHDGTVGWKRYAPYERILGTGGVPEVPSSLLDQLDEDGLIVIPVGSKRQQRLYKVKKRGQKVTYSKGVYCSFVPLVGSEGW
ncbi:protein-L-isoaspartate(D-aspartate) O-methyltransferase [Candidatus Bipolaricaulota bacterium]|nr:protein-L-isoaspartate(D-aspartate) O-methyltransferase [Candidatus Bipolaricaulota bacterium]